MRLFYYFCIRYLPFPPEFAVEKHTFFATLVARRRTRIARITPAIVLWRTIGRAVALRRARRRGRRTGRAIGNARRIGRADFHQNNVLAYLLNTPPRNKHVLSFSEQPSAGERRDDAFHLSRIRGKNEVGNSAELSSVARVYDLFGAQLAKSQFYTYAIHKSYAIYMRIKRIFLLLRRDFV